MKNKIQRILKSTFFQVLVVYAIIVVMISVNLFWKFTLHMEIFALVLGGIGIAFVLGIKDEKKEKKKEKKTFLNFLKKNWILILALLLVIGFRFVPYFNNTTPIGYDPGIYKYAIEKSFDGQQDDWMKSSITPGFSYITSFLRMLGFSSNAILIPIFIIFNALICFAIYLFTKEHFGKKAGLLASLIFAVSTVQFKVFTFLYYKNIIALSMLLFSLYFLKKKKMIWFAVFAIVCGIVHRATFFIFAVSFLLYAVISPIKRDVFTRKIKYDSKKLLKYLIYGVIIIGITLLFYLPTFNESILPLIKPVASSVVESDPTTAGTFLDSFTYHYATLAYLPLALLGFFFLIKKKKFNMLFFLAIVTAIIVYFKLYFFNRFIIHLDIALIALAAGGFALALKERKWLTTILIILLVFSSGFVMFNEAKDTKPLINENDLTAIKSLQETEQNAYAMSTHSYYSPWVLGYSGRRTLAPGLFDDDKWNFEMWQAFWLSPQWEDVQKLLEMYDGPVYIFIGENHPDYISRFDNDCFEIYYEKEGQARPRVYKYLC